MGWSSIGTVVGGGQLATAGGTPVQPVTDQLTSGDLGTGADGAVTLSANATLVRDMQYSSLTVNVAVVLNTAGYVIRCQGVLTNNGIIANDGGNGQAVSLGTGTPGAGAPNGTLFGGGGGGYGGSVPVVSNGASPPAADVEGGPGGNATVTQTGLGGTVTISGAIGLSMPGLRSLRYSGGGGGGIDSHGSGTGASAGGGGGGVVIIFTGSTAGNGDVHANGGAGAAWTQAPSGSNPSEAGAGGGGGICYIACRARGDAWTVTASGGAGAVSTGNIGTGTAQNGWPGRAGVLVCNGG